ncbi:hypothetical protein [Phenylobacterium soli]|nr:hypothetical protein [Phenylobacterium soli]
MRLVSLPLAGAGGREVHVNPEQVVCLVDAGQRRTQLVTTGFQGEASMTLMLDLSVDEAALRLADGAAPARVAA